MSIPRSLVYGVKAGSIQNIDPVYRSPCMKEWKNYFGIWTKRKKNLYPERKKRKGIPHRKTVNYTP